MYITVWIFVALANFLYSIMTPLYAICLYIENFVRLTPPAWKVAN